MLNIKSGTKSEELQRESQIQEQLQEKIHDYMHYQKLNRNLWLMYFIRGFSSIHFFGSVMILFFEDWGGISFSEIMVLEAIFTGGIFILEIPTGTIADKYSRRLSLIFSYMVNIIAIFIYVSHASFITFALGEITWAAATALNSGASDAFLYDTLVELEQEHRSKKIFARLQKIGLTTMIIGSLSGGFIAVNFGLSATMLFSAFPLIIALGLSFALEEPVTHQTSRKDSPWEIFAKGWKNIRSNASLKRLIADSVVLSVVAYYILWIWQKRVNSLALDVTWFGLIHTGMIVAQILILSVFRPLERKFEARGWQKAKLLIIQGTSFGTGLGILLMGIFDTLWVVILSIILGAGLGLSRRVILTNYMQKHISSEQRATTISTVSMIRMVLLLVLNPIIGKAVEYSMLLTLLILGGTAIIWSLANRLQESDLVD
ncbi:MAG: MFS transporter [Candidatus Lokiarchaeota archaeon]|nr:MFS transporter [Candidatus Harpocratesius repetitus]